MLCYLFSKWKSQLSLNARVDDTWVWMSRIEVHCGPSLETSYYIHQWHSIIIRIKYTLTPNWKPCLNPVGSGDPRSWFLLSLTLKVPCQGSLGGSVGWASDFGSGHDLVVCEFKPRIRLCADSSEPGACFESPPLSLPLPCSCSVSLCLKNK